MGTRDSKADRQVIFSSIILAQTLGPVGDILDVWRIQQNKWRWKQSHTNVVRRVLGMPCVDRVIYVAG